MASESDGEAFDRYLKRSPETAALISEMRGRLAEMIEPYTTGARSLLVAHGAAIFASLQYLADAKDDTVRMASFYAGAFCVGFCLAALGTFASLYAKQYMLSYSWERNQSCGLKELYICGMLLIVSLAILIFSVAAIGMVLIRSGIGT